MAIDKLRQDITQKQGLLNLCELVKSYIGDDNLQIVEIGSYCGESGEIIANTFPNSTINCVDPWEKYTEEGSIYDLNEQELVLKEAERVFDSVLARNKNMRKNKMPSLDYAKLTSPESIDFIYIDGNHQYTSVKEDLNTWYPKIKLGGVIAGHDYGWVSVNKAISEFFKNQPPVAVYPDGSWFYLKTN